MTDKPNSNLLEPNSNLLEPKRCELEETESYEAARVGWNGELETFTVHVHECTECGIECEQVNGSYKRCPHCGAINVLDEDYRAEVIPNGEKYKDAPDDGVARSNNGVDSRDSIEEDACTILRKNLYGVGDLGRAMGILEPNELVGGSGDRAYIFERLADLIERDYVRRDSITDDATCKPKQAVDKQANCGTAEDGASRVPESDSREELEADVLERVKEGFITYTELIGWLDRQKRITMHEHQEGCKYKAKADELQERLERQAAYLARLNDDIWCYKVELARNEKTIDELKADAKKWADAANEQRLVAIEQADKVQELTAERDEWQRTADDYKERKDALVAERDRLRRFVDGGAYDCMTCEAKAELAERADSLEAELARKQRACDVQRESFLKLEVENAELRKELGK